MRDGVLLIGHGTRDPLGTAQFFQLEKRLADTLAGTPVQASLLELQPPTIEQGWQRLVDQGVERVIAAPLLLFAAGHAKQDIPSALAACQQQAPNSPLPWIVSNPLSRSPEVIDLAVERLDQAIAETELAADAYAQQTAVVVVGRGNRDPCAQADLRVLAECVAGRRRPRMLRIAFYTMATPPLDQTLNEVASDASIRQVIVVPHILFAGVIDQSIRRLMEEAAERHPQVRFHCAQYLGPDQRVAAALARRIDQATRPSGH